MDVSNTSKFNYEKAFGRNIGWLTKLEQQQLRTKKVALAGMGGVGGFHLLTLTRLGIGNFHISDMDSFEIQNFNRQVGANMETLDLKKVEVLEGMAKNVNPELNIKTFPTGISENNIDDFLTDVDLYVDCLDFFVLDLRAKIFKRCHELNIPAITAAPIGLGTGYLIFMPGEMTFEEYFNFDGKSEEQRRIHFLIGLNPKMLAFRYLVDPSAVNFEEKRGPSTVMACELASGVIGVEAIKILLNRGSARSVPHYYLFDAYLTKFVKGWMPGGNHNPIQKIKIFFIQRTFNKIKELPVNYSKKPSIVYSSDMEKILDLARWAPSGDNSQPWRFEIKNNNQIVILAKDESSQNLYDFSGFPTLLSCGFLLETIRIAATQFGRDFHYNFQKVTDHHYQFQVDLLPNQDIRPDPLGNFIALRSVNRTRYRNIPLTPKQKLLLEASISENKYIQIYWFESLKEKWEIGKLNALSTSIRLRLPELYPIHKKVFHMENEDVTDGIPIDATGMSMLSKKVMSWAIKKWPRINFLNRFFGATYTTALELDLIPAVYSSAHFILVANKNLQNITQEELYLRAGQAMQKFWLTAEKLGLSLQPTLASKIFTYHARNTPNFTKDIKLSADANSLADMSDRIFPGQNILFKGRIGQSVVHKRNSRSLRKPLSELLKPFSD